MKNSGIPISSLSPKVQAMIRAADRGALPPQGSHPLHEPHNDTAAGGGPAIRQQRGPALNKTEAAFLDHLRAAQPGATVRAQDVTLRLANGTRYTPDFFVDPMIGAVPDLENSFRAEAYEVKGFMRDDARVDLTVAARAFPWIRFFLVSRKGRAQPWRIQEILP